MTELLTTRARGQSQPADALSLELSDSFVIRFSARRHARSRAGVVSFNVYRTDRAAAAEPRAHPWIW